MENITQILTSTRLTVETTFALDEIRAANAKIFAALREKYTQLYPDVIIDNNFIFEISRALRAEKACENCKGYPCQNRGFTGSKHKIVKAQGREGTYLNIVYCPCQHALMEREKAREKAAFKRARLPYIYRGKSFEDYEVTPENKNAVTWAKRALQDDLSLYIYGAPGVGKTFLTAILAQEFMKQGQSVIFGDVPTLLDELKGSFDARSETTLGDLMAKLENVDVLILDDLGTENATEWAVERLYLIVNARYVTEKRLIVTSNYNLTNLASRLDSRRGEDSVTGSRIASRLKGKCKIAQIGGTDYRCRR